MFDPIDRILPNLRSVRKSGRSSWMALCPAHEDKNASLSVRLFDDNSVSVKCFSGCTTVAVLSAMGMSVADMFPGSRKPADFPFHRPAPGRKAWRDVIAFLREDLAAVSIGAARMAAGDELSESDLDRLGLAALRIQDILQG